MLYNCVFREINKIKKKQQDDAIATAFDILSGGSSDSKSSLIYGKSIEEKGDEFELNVFGQSKYWSISEKVTKYATVRRVKELYKDAAGIDTPVDIVLFSKGKQLSCYVCVSPLTIMIEQNIKYTFILNKRKHWGIMV